MCACVHVLVLVLVLVLVHVHVHVLVHVRTLPPLCARSSGKCPIGANEGCSPFPPSAGAQCYLSLDASQLRQRGAHLYDLAAAVRLEIPPLTASAPIRVHAVRRFTVDVPEVDVEACLAGAHGCPSSRMVLVGLREVGLVISEDGPLRHYVTTEQLA